jgi:polar amino acid transport system permease protein
MQGIAAYPIRLYITVLRNTPPLVLLFLVYFFAGSFFSEPLLHLEEFLSRQPFWIQEGCAVLIAPPGQLDRMLAAILTLGLYSGAYVAEIVRGALESVDRGQWDASASLGMNSSQQMRWVIFPQAFRIMIPSLTGQTIAIFKETALASVISLPELTFQSLEVMAVTRMTFELWLLTAGLYLLISCCWGWLGRYLERKQPR